MRGLREQLRAWADEAWDRRDEAWTAARWIGYAIGAAWWLLVMFYAVTGIFGPSSPRSRIIRDLIDGAPTGAPLSF